MRIRNASLALICACATEQLVMAHPGHTVQPENPSGLTHYLFHPDHVAQWIIVGIAIACGIALIRTIKRPSPAYARKS